jgi:hypothetical protein
VRSTSSILDNEDDTGYSGAYHRRSGGGQKDWEFGGSPLHSPPASNLSRPSYAKFWIALMFGITILGVGMFMPLTRLAEEVEEFEELHIVGHHENKVRIRGEMLLKVLLPEAEDCIDIEMTELGAGSTCKEFAALGKCGNALQGKRMAQLVIADFCQVSCGKCQKEEGKPNNASSQQSIGEEEGDGAPPPPAPLQFEAAPPEELSKARPSSGYFGVVEDVRRGRTRYKVFLIIDGEKERIKTWFHTKSGAAAAFDLAARRHGMICDVNCNFLTCEEAEAAAAAEMEFVSAAHEAQMQLSAMHNT